MRMLNGILIWHAQRLLRSFGWLGVAGAILALAVVLFQLWVLVPLRSSVADMRDEAVYLRKNIATRHMEYPKQDSSTQLIAFYGFFPDGDVMTDVLGRIYSAAAHENLILEHGEYQLDAVHEGNLLRYNLIFPIKGPYTKLRRFIAIVLQKNPSLALDGVSFSRQSAMEIGVSAQVRMTLFLRAE